MGRTGAVVKYIELSAEGFEPQPGRRPFGLEQVTLTQLLMLRSEINRIFNS